MRLHEYPREVPDRKFRGRREGGDGEETPVRGRRLCGRRGLPWIGEGKSRSGEATPAQSMLRAWRRGTDCGVICSLRRGGL